MGCHQGFQATSDSLLSPSGVPAESAAVAPQSSGEIERSMREIAPLDHYGYAGYLLSKDHGIVKIDDDYIITGPSCFQLGFNCYDINRLLVNKLRQAGKTASLVVGEDAKGIFNHHYFARSEGKTYDAVGLYAFDSAAHTFRKNSKVEIDESDAKNITNPVRVFSLEGRQFISLMDFVFRSDRSGAPRIGLNMLIKDISNPKARTSINFSCDLATYQQLVGPHDHPYLDNEQAKTILLQLIDAPNSSTYWNDSPAVRKVKETRQFEQAVFHEAEILVACLHKMAYPTLFPEK